MNKLLLILWLGLAFLASAQQFLPKESNYLPTNDLFSVNIARSGRNSFWKVDGHGWSSVISSKPVRPNSITKITFYLEKGATFHLGVTKKDLSQLAKGDPCVMANTVAYYTPTGNKCKGSDQAAYSSRAYEGDNITLTVDTRPYKYEVSYAKNGLPMGISYSGLDEWGDDIYIIFAIHYVEERITLSDYTVI
jgi:hypothetical protein